MRVLGCDYSTKEISVVALDKKGKICTRAYMKLVQDSIPDTIVSLQAIFLGQKGQEKDAVVYIEKPWGRMNYATSMQMTRMATIIEVAAVLLGKRVKWAHPSTWRKKVYGKGTRVAKNIRKQMALQAFRDLWDTEASDHNEAEAAMIALFGFLEEGGKLCDKGLLSLQNLQEKLA